MEPLKPLVLNIERGSRSPSPSGKRKAVQLRAPRNSEPFPRNRHSLSESVDSFDDAREDPERWHKRRRISFPAKEEYSSRSVSHVSIAGTSTQIQPGSLLEAAVSSRSRLDKFRCVHNHE